MYRILDYARVSRAVGDTPLLQLPLRCSWCGELGHGVVVSSRSLAGLGGPA